MNFIENYFFQVGVYFYDDSVHGTYPVGFPLGAYPTKPELLNAISRLQYPGKMRAFNFGPLINETLQHKFARKYCFCFIFVPYCGVGNFFCFITIPNKLSLPFNSLKVFLKFWHPCVYIYSVLLPFGVSRFLFKICYSILQKLNIFSFSMLQQCFTNDF